MAIICTVLHICNTPHSLVLVYNITWIQNCSFVMFCTRDTEKQKRHKKKIKMKKRTRRTGEVWALNRGDVVIGAAVSSIYCAAFTKSFLYFYVHVSFKSVFCLFFLYTVTGSPCCSRCLERFLQKKKKRNTLYLFLYVVNMAVSSAGVVLSPWRRAFTQMEAVEEEEEDVRCGFVCRLIGFHKALPHI